MARTKFPKVIHIVEEVPANDDPYLIVAADGILGLDVEQDVAVYQLVKVGRVKISKTFQDK